MGGREDFQSQLKFMLRYLEHGFFFKKKKLSLNIEHTQDTRLTKLTTKEEILQRDLVLLCVIL